jgi:hypothetical protein
MTSNRRRLAAQSAGALAAGVTSLGATVETASAHHSYPATYDTNKRVVMSGIVQLVRFSNPHVHIVIETAAPGEQPPSVAAAQAQLSAVPAEPALAEDGSVIEGTGITATSAEVIQAATASTQAAAEALASGSAAGATPRAAAEPPPTMLWVLDMPAPNQARNMGLTPELLTPGVPITVEAWPSRSAGSHDLAPLVLNIDHIGRTFRIRR